MLFGDTRLAGHPVSLADQCITFVMQYFRMDERGRRTDACGLKVENVTPLPFDLHTHASDLGLDVVEVHGQSRMKMAQLEKIKNIVSNNNRR